MKIIYNFFYIIFFLCISFSCFSKTLETYDLKYEITHLLNKKGSPLLKVDLSIAQSFIKKIKNNKKEEMILLILPSEFSAGKDLFKNIKNLHALDKRVKIKKGELPDEREVYFPNSLSTINLSYEIYPSKEISLFRPLIKKDIFHFIGHTALAYPYSENKKNLKIILQWNCLKSRTSIRNMTKNIIANSFGISKDCQVLSLPLKDLLHATYTGGKYNKNSFRIQNTAIHLIAHGVSLKLTNYTSKLLKKIIPYQRAFWQDKLFPYYLVILLSNNKGLITYDGSQTAQAFSLMVNENSPFLKEELPFFIAHENWHNWLGGKLKQSEANSYQSMAWFNEGFTDYYGQLTALKSQAVTAEAFIQKYNRVLVKYYLSPVRERPNQDIIQYFDKDQFFSELPYLRGAIFACELNHSIKLSSNNVYSLDNVLKDLFYAYQKNIENKKNYSVSILEFKKRLKKYLPDAEDYIKEYIELGKLLSPSANALGEGIKLSFKPIKPENYGINLKETFLHRRLIEVEPGSIAYQKGLREGQVVLAHQFDHADLNEPLKIKVRIGKQTKLVILTREGETIQVPQYYLDR